MKDYSGYKWIKVKQFKFDKEKSWEENYKELEKHHIEETTFLINEIRDLSQEYNELDEKCDTYYWEKESLNDRVEYLRRHSNE